MTDPEHTEETPETEMTEETTPEAADEHDEELTSEVEDDEISPGEEAFVRGYINEREDEQKE